MRRVVSALDCICLCFVYSIFSMYLLSNIQICISVSNCSQFCVCVLIVFAILILGKPLPAKMDEFWRVEGCVAIVFVRCFLFPCIYLL